MWRAIKWVVTSIWAVCFAVGVGIITNWLQAKDLPNLALALSFLSGHKLYFIPTLIALAIAARYAQQRDVLKRLERRVSFYRSTKQLRPSDIVLSVDWYDPYFIERGAVGKVRQHIAADRGVLLQGIPLIGKTRCALEALKGLKGYYVLGLRPHSLGLEDMRLPRQWLVVKPRVVLFLDDLQRFVDRFTPDDARRQLLKTGRQITVLATCRSGEEMELAARDQAFSSLMSRELRRITVEELTKPEEQRLAAHFGRDWRATSYNGTPGAIVFDLEQMNQRLNAASVEIQTLMRSLFLLNSVGISLYSRHLVQQTADEVYDVRIGKAAADSAWLWLEQHGFLGSADERVSPTHSVYIESSFRPEYLAGDHEEAIQRLWHLVSRSGNLQFIAAIAGHMGRLRHHEMAETCARRFLEISSEDACGHLMLAGALGGQGRVAEFEAVMREAIKSNPRWGLLHAILGAVQFELGNTAEGERELHEAVSLDPECGPTRMFLGKVNHDLGLLQEARAELQRALELAPNLHQANYWLGVTVAKLGDDVSAEKELRTALDANPHYAEARTQLAILLEEKGQLEQAEREYREAVRCGPQNASSHACLARFLSEQGRAEEAIKEYCKAIECDPSRAVTHLMLGVLLCEVGRTEWAIAKLQDVLKHDSHRIAAAARLLLGIICLEQGRSEEASEHLGESVRCDPSSAVFHHIRGGLLLLEKRGAEAEDAFREAIRLRPDYSEAHAYLGSLLRERGEPRAALTELREAVRSDPSNISARQLLAITLHEFGLAEEAIEEIKEVIRRAPGRFESQTVLAYLLFSDGRFQEAETEARRLLGQDTGSFVGHYILASIFYERRKFWRARKHVRKLKHLLGGAQALSDGNRQLTA